MLMRAMHVGKMQDVCMLRFKREREITMAHMVAAVSSTDAVVWHNLVQGKRPLHEAAGRGKHDAVAALIKHGEDPNVLMREVLITQPLSRCQNRF